MSGVGRAAAAAGAAEAPSGAGAALVSLADDGGAALVRADLAGACEPWWWSPAAWCARGRVVAESAGGRGGVSFVRAPVTARDGATPVQWAVRAYRRGGLVRHLLREQYLFLGAQRTRAFRELHLLAALHARGFPVPRPVAAHFRRRGVCYRAVLLTERIADAEPLSRRLSAAGGAAAHALDLDVWRGLGHLLRRLHDAGVWHADLNAHNVLVDVQGRCHVIDFDRGRFTPGRPLTPRAAAGNLRRFARSLRKLGLLAPAAAGRGDGAGVAAAGWAACLEAYRRSPA